MAIYRNITTRFWSDSKIKDEFTPEDKFFFIYLLTNEHTNICGCYEIAQKDMTLETGYNWETAKMLLDRMERVHKVLQYSPDTKEVLINNFGKYNWSDSTKVITAVRNVAQYIKNDCFKKYVLEKADEKEKAIEKKKRKEPKEKQITDNRIQITDTDTDVSIGYGYGMDRVSKTKKKKRSNIDQYNSFPQNSYDYDALEDDLLANNGKNDTID